MAVSTAIFEWQRNSFLRKTLAHVPSIAQCCFDIYFDFIVCHTQYIYIFTLNTG